MDSFSRNFNEAIDWNFNAHLFLETTSMFGTPTLNLFAPHINNPIDRYMSWKANSKALETGEFSLNFIISFPLLAC